MSISTAFIKRPIATSLLTLALAMAGALGFYFLPVAPLSEVADICFDGIVNDTFWITAPSEVQQAKIRARAASQIEMTEPQYLLVENLMTSRPSAE